MGGFVVTNTVRILSDVFDRQSIGGLGVSDKTKAPSPDIGKRFFTWATGFSYRPTFPPKPLFRVGLTFLAHRCDVSKRPYLF